MLSFEDFIINNKVPNIDRVLGRIDLPELQSGSATNHTLSTSSGEGWLNPTNVYDNDLSTFVTLQGQNLVSNSGDVVLDSFDVNNVGTIQKVEILYYGVADTGSGTPTYELSYDLGGSPTLLDSFSDHDNTLAPIIYDITSDRAWTWTDVSNLRTTTSGSISAGILGASWQVAEILLRITTS